MLVLGERPGQSDGAESAFAPTGRAQGGGRVKPSPVLERFGPCGPSSSRLWLGVLPPIGCNFSPIGLELRRRARPPAAMTRVELPGRTKRDSSGRWKGTAVGFRSLGDGIAGIVGNRSCRLFFGEAGNAIGGNLVGPWTAGNRRVRLSIASRDPARRRIGANANKR